MTSSLQDLLDAFLNGDCPPEAFLSELSAYCNATPGSSWEVLALLDQYHRRGKLSGDHFRTFRRKIEFHALGIADPGEVHGLHQPVVIDEPAIAAPAARDEEEILRLRAALESERERSQRYRHRIETLAEYGRQHRSISRAHAVGQPRAKTSTRKGLVAAWLTQQRRLKHPRAWASAAVLVASATVISGSSPNPSQAPNGLGLAATPVSFEPAPQLPAAILEPRTISLASEKFIVLPGSSVATIQVDRTGDIGDVARFKWWTQSAGAKSGKDFIGKSQVAQFDAGATSLQLPVRILANPQRTHTEMFYVAIGEPDDEVTQVPNGRAAVFIMRAN